MNKILIRDGGDVWNAMVGNGDLADQVTPTSFKVYSNEEEAVVDVTSKLFLAAAKEMGLSSGEDAEADVLSTFEYYQTNDANADRVKSFGSDAEPYWLRSPAKSKDDEACCVSATGTAASAEVCDAENVFVAVCFAL